MARAKGQKTERREDDDYPTPDWATDAVLPLLLPLLTPRQTALEPSCGGGAILRRLLHHGALPTQLHGIERHAGRAEEATASTRVLVTVADALDPAVRGLWRNHRLIIGNPPFSHAEAFCRAALEARDESLSVTTVAMLLRLAFLESAERYAFHQQYPVTQLRVFTSRPSFTADGKSDSCAYAWFVWGDVAPGISFVPPHAKPKKAKVLAAPPETPAHPLLQVGRVDVPGGEYRPLR
jgi:hypothetical protein